MARLHFAAEQVRESEAYWLHPVMLDACTLLVAAALPANVRDRDFILGRVEGIRKDRPFPETVWAHVRLRSPGPDHARLSADLTVYDQDGRSVVAATGLELVQTGAPGLRADRYQVRWKEAPPVPRLTDEIDIDVADLQRMLLPVLDRAAGSPAFADYDTFLPRLERVALEWVRRALADLGWRPGSDAVGMAEQARALGVADRHVRLLARLVDMIADRQAGEGTIDAPADPALPADDPGRMGRELSERFPAFEGQSSLVARCGPALPSVLTGARDPLDLLFPGGSFDVLEALYERAPAARAYNDLVARAVAGIAGYLGRTLRVLEIGAGTGGTTAAVLPRLDPTRTAYTFTDLSPFFLSRAREKFAPFPFVTYALFDVERDLAEQGLEPGAYDVVVAANVLHATTDLARTLDRVRSLLARGGVLVLLEASAAQRWVDVTFGLTEGWWRFADTSVREDHPLVGVETWRRLLAGAGFDQVSAVGGEGDRPSAQQAVILARVPAGHPLRRDEIARQIVAVGQSAVAPWLDDAGGAALVARDAGALRAICGDLTAAGTPADVVCCWPAVPTETPADVEQAVWQGVERLEIVLQAGLPAGSRLWFVTDGAQPAGDAVPVSLAGAAVTGLGRGISVEHPDLWGGLIDLDPAAAPEDRARAIAGELARSDAEDQVAVRGGRRLVPRLAADVTAADEGGTIRPDAIYLITGGLGGVGVSVADWLVARGARHLMLATRRPLPGLDTRADGAPAADGPAAENRRRVAAVERLEAAGATVHVVVADVADRVRMSAVFHRFGRDLPPLAGVFHAAAAIASCAVGDLDEPAVHAMMRPKVTGAAVLDELTRGLPLDFLVLFSSTTALWGAQGLAHYAAANAYLDALAHRRRAEGRPFTSVNWGTWDVMRLAGDADRQAFTEAGLWPMTSTSALDTWSRRSTSGAAQIAIASVDWRALKSLYESRRPRPLLADVGGEARHATHVVRSRAAASWRERLDEAAPDDRADLLRELVAGEVARILGADDPSLIDRDKGLFEMGMDSLMSVELKARLEQGLGVPLPSTLTFNYPNVNALTRFLAGMVTETGPAPAPAPAAAAATDELSEDALAELLASRLDEIR